MKYLEAAYYCVVCLLIAALPVGYAAQFLSR